MNPWAPSAVVVRPEDTRTRLVPVPAAGPVRRRGTHGNLSL